MKKILLKSIFNLQNVPKGVRAFPEGSGIKILYNPENGEYLITK